MSSRIGELDFNFLDLWGVVVTYEGLQEGFWLVVLLMILSIIFLRC